MCQFGVIIYLKNILYIQKQKINNKCTEKYAIEKSKEYFEFSYLLKSGFGFKNNYWPVSSKNKNRDRYYIF